MNVANIFSQRLAAKPVAKPNEYYVARVFNGKPVAGSAVGSGMKDRMHEMAKRLNESKDLHPAFRFKAFRCA